MDKAPDAFRTISEVSEWLGVPSHVLRFWESRFPEVSPVKRAGGRRYYRPEDMRLLGGIKVMLHDEGQTIRAVQDKLAQDGPEALHALSPDLDTATAPSAMDNADAAEADLSDTAAAMSALSDTDPAEEDTPAPEPDEADMVPEIAPDEDAPIASGPEPDSGPDPVPELSSPSPVEPDPEDSPEDSQENALFSTRRDSGLGRFQSRRHTAREDAPPIQGFFFNDLEEDAEPRPVTAEEKDAHMGGGYSALETLDQNAPPDPAETDETDETDIIPEPEPEPEMDSAEPGDPMPDLESAEPSEDVSPDLPEEEEEVALEAEAPPAPAEPAAPKPAFDLPKDPPELDPSLPRPPTMVAELRGLTAAEIRERVGEDTLRALSLRLTQVQDRMAGLP